MEKNGIIIRKREEVTKRSKEYKVALTALLKPAKDGGAVIVAPSPGPYYTLVCADLCSGRGDWSFLLSQIDCVREWHFIDQSPVSCRALEEAIKNVIGLACQYFIHPLPVHLFPI